MDRRGLPQYYKQRPWTELFDFTAAEVSFNASSGVIESTVDPVTGRPAIKWSGMDAGATLSDFNFTPATSFTLDDIADEPIRLSVHAAVQGTGLSLAFGMTGLTVGTKKSYFFTTDTIGVGESALLTHQDLPVDPFNASRVWTGTGDTSLTVDKLQIQLGGVVANQVLYFSPIDYGGRARPKIMFGIDNHSNTFGAIQTTMLPDMQALNWPGYMAWSSNINPWAGGTDLADTLAMVSDDNWVICNHSIDHANSDDIDASDDPVAYATQQYNDNAAFQIAEGFPASHLRKYTSQPQNKMSDNLKNALDNEGYVYSRAISPAFISGVTAQYNGNWTGTVNIGSKTAAGAAADSQAIVDYNLNAAVLLGCSVNFFTHGIHDTENDFINNTDWDYFIAQVTKYNDNRLIDLVSVDEWYKGLTYPRISL